MIIDALNLPNGAAIETDVCIIGAGAAGITLAHRLNGQPFRVCLLESGGLSMEQRTQRLYEGESVGLPYELETTRSRFFGGSTNCWGGFCRPFESYHFEARPWVPDSGWPISAADLEPYYFRAHEICGIDVDGYDADARLRAVPGEGLSPLPLAPERLLTSVAQVNVDRRRFGEAFREEVRGSSNVTVYLHSNVVELVAGDGGAHVQRARARTLGGKELTVTAKAFVLASGAVENARLLLASHGHDPRGLGNAHDTVGRYFMEHPTQQMAEFDIAPVASQAFKAYIDRYAILRLPMAAELNVPYPIQQAERLLDSAAHIELILVGEESPGATAAKRLYRDLWRGCLPPKPLAQLAAIVSAPISVAAFAYGLYSNSERFVRSRRLTISLEQCPNRESRVTLSHERDAIGMQRVRLDWRLTDLDRDCMQRTTRLMVEELRRAGVVSGARMCSEEDFGLPRWNWHQMGTTRMHEDPERGVVDSQCKVHGVANLFVAGSSVFPTAGNHTPTLTIVALAARLSDHLRKQLSRDTIQIVHRNEALPGLQPLATPDLAAREGISAA